MGQASTAVTIEVAPTDLADLERWARNSERTVADLLQEALRHYLDYVRADLADLEEAEKGPFYTLDEVKAYLVEHRAERIRDHQAQAAE